MDVCDSTRDRPDFWNIHCDRYPLRLRSEGQDPRDLDESFRCVSTNLTEKPTETNPLTNLCDNQSPHGSVYYLVKITI